MGTQRGLYHFGTLKALRHLMGTKMELGDSRHWELEAHLGPPALKVLGHSDTRALKGHLGTKALLHSGTRDTFLIRFESLDLGSYSCYNLCIPYKLFYFHHILVLLIFLDILTL